MTTFSTCSCAISSGMISSRRPSWFTFIFPAGPPASAGNRSNPACACWQTKPAFPKAQCKLRSRSCSIDSWSEPRAHTAPPCPPIASYDTGDREGDAQRSNSNRQSTFPSSLISSQPMLGGAPRFGRVTHPGFRNRMPAIISSRGT